MLEQLNFYTRKMLTLASCHNLCVEKLPFHHPPIIYACWTEAVVSKTCIRDIAHAYNFWNHNNFSYCTCMFLFFWTGLSEELGACPPGWVENSALGAVKACYQLRTHSETWVDAQKYCNYDQANLVSLENGQEVKFVTGIYFPSYLV